MTGKELEYITDAYTLGKLSGNGKYTKLCHGWLQQQTTAAKVLLTHSCTSALEMASILCDLHPGDEVIMPSYTFVSTANAVVLRHAVPVFVDIRPDTMNINEHLIEAAITPRTKAICVVHYAGVGCEMDTIMEIARRKERPPTSPSMSGSRPPSRRYRPIAQDAARGWARSPDP
jgi:dTDP-4-amino-4,6-dideoxygalactose transaminase